MYQTLIEFDYHNGVAIDTNGKTTIQNMKGDNKHTFLDILTMENIVEDVENKIAKRESNYMAGKLMMWSFRAVILFVTLVWLYTICNGIFPLAIIYSLLPIFSTGLAIFNKHHMKIERSEIDKLLADKKRYVTVLDEIKKATQYQNTESEAISIPDLSSEVINVPLIPPIQQNNLSEEKKNTGKVRIYKLETFK